MAERLKRDGWDIECFDLMLAASGGPKWLVLYGLDLRLAAQFSARRRELHLIGSSIGSWRQACHAQGDAAAAFARFRAAYLEPWDARDGPQTLFRRTLDRLLGEHGAAEIVANSRLRQHVVTTRLERPRGALIRDYAGAVIGNAIARPLLTRGRLSRSVTSVVPLPAGTAYSIGHPRVLTGENLREVLLASAAVPGWLDAVRLEDEDAVHVDGGVVDYHFHPGEFRGLSILYPHFYPHLAPGWFDRFTRRRVPAAALSDTLLLVPSDAFVASLPYGRIPDRRDGRRLPPEALVDYWQTVFARSIELGDEFHHLVASGEFVRQIEIVGHQR